MDSGKKADIGGVCLCFLGECSTIFKMFCTSLNSRKLLWLPQEMGRGNPGPPAALEAQDNSGQMGEGRWRADGQTLPLDVALIWRRIGWEGPFSATTGDRVDPSCLSSGPELTCGSSSVLWLLCSAARWPPQTLWILLARTSAAASGTFKGSSVIQRVKSRIFTLSKNAAAEMFSKGT